jgi:hypothetical protein
MHLDALLTDEDTSDASADYFESRARACLRLADDKRAVYPENGAVYATMGNAYATLALQARLAELNSEGIAVH